jgi:hypothetical protein
VEHDKGWFFSHVFFGIMRQYVSRLEKLKKTGKGRVDMMGFNMTKEEKNFVLQGVAAWVPMPFIAVLNAAFRDEALRPMMGPEWAGVASGLMLVVGLYACAWFFLTRVMTPCSMCAPMVVGSIWVALSLAFEFFITVIWLREPFAEFARVFGYSNIGEGNFVMAALVLLFFAPCLFSSRQNNSASNDNGVRA